MRYSWWFQRTFRQPSRFKGTPSEDDPSWWWPHCMVVYRCYCRDVSFPFQDEPFYLGYGPGSRVMWSSPSPKHEPYRRIWPVTLDWWWTLSLSWVPGVRRRRLISTLRFGPLNRLIRPLESQDCKYLTWPGDPRISNYHQGRQIADCHCWRSYRGITSSRCWLDGSRPLYRLLRFAYRALRTLRVSSGSMELVPSSALDPKLFDGSIWSRTLDLKELGLASCSFFLTFD